MDQGRRFFLRVVGVGFLFIGADAGFASSAMMPQQQGSNPPNRVPPQNANPMKPLEPPLFQPPSSAQLRQNEREIKKDVDQLFDLAQELKRQAAKSDASKELSVALIEKTEEIEKLAKKIHDLARG